MENCYYDYKSEYIECVLQVKKEKEYHKISDKAALTEMTQLISGSFVSPLYGALWQNGFDVDTITEHFETLHQNEDFFGIIYFVFILSDAVDFVLPPLFSEVSVDDVGVQILSAAIVEDWFEYAEISDVELREE